MRHTEDIAPWWREDDGNAHDCLWRLLEVLESYDAQRRKDMLLHLALYGDKGAVKAKLGAVRERMARRRDAVRFNAIKSVADASQAIVGNQTAKPRFLTSRGDYTRQKQAQDMELVVAGEYDLCDVYGQAPVGYLDAAKTGTTGFKVFRQGSRVRCELVRPGQLIVDPVDGQYRAPRALYEVAFVDRSVAMSLYGEDEETRKAIREAPRADSKTLFPWLPADTMVDQIKIIEAWRLPDPEDWGDPQPGRHVLAVQGATLIDEEWERSTFPFVLWRYDTESTGFWGAGISSNLKDSQIELNMVLEKIAACIDLSAGYRLVVSKGAKISVRKLDNEPGTILESADGSTPQVITENTVPQQLIDHAQRIIDRCYEQEGVSQLSAASKKPTGLDSGAALREYNDIESERLGVKAKSWEKFLGVDLAKAVVAVKQEIADDGADVPVRVEQRKGRGIGIRQVKWQDVALDSDDYAVRVFPASALPSTPAGRMATVESWIGAGLVSQDEAKQLLDFPDLAAFSAYNLADHEIILEAVERMIDDGETVMPDPVQDFELTRKLVSKAYQRYVADGVSEERTELLLEYLDATMHLAMAAMPQEPMPGPPEQGGPPLPDDMPPEAMLPDGGPTQMM